MSNQATSVGSRVFLAAACILCAAPQAEASLFWQSGVRAKSIKVCFVGNAVTARPARVQQIQSYLSDYGYAANIQFNFIGACPAQATQMNGNAFFDGDIRVVLPGTSAPFTGIVPGKGCTMFLENGIYNGGNDGGGSWSNSPNDLPGNRSCLYNLKLNDDGDANGVPWRNHTLHEFGHALGLAHEHVRADVDRTICSPSWSYWLSNTGTWPKSSLILGSPAYSQAELINLLNAQPAKEDASLDLARPLIAAKLSAVYGTNTADVNSAIPSADSLLAAFNGKLPYVVTTTAGKGPQMVTLAGQLDTAYGGGASTGFLTPYDRASVMHYKFGSCGIQGNYDNTGLSTWDRLAVHILYPEDNFAAEFIGTTVIPSSQSVYLQSAWAARGAVMSVVASNFRWTVNGSLKSTSPDVYTTLPLGDNAFSLTHMDFLGRAYTYNGTIKVLTPIDYDRYMAAVRAAGSSLL